MFWRRPVARAVLATAVVACGGVMLARAFWSIDLGATRHAVVQIGLLAPLALLPFLGGMALDAAGMRIILRLLGRPVSLKWLLPIRVATEALHVTAPAGFLVADSATAKLLELHTGVPLSEGAMLAIARKWLVMRAHALYIVLGAVAGAAVLMAVSERHLGGPWLPWAIGASALLPLTLSLALGLGLREGSVFARLQKLAEKLPWPALGTRTRRWREGAVAVDARLASVGRAGWVTWLAATAFLGAWLFEALDTAVIVRLVGGPPAFGFALACEVAISMLRSIGNVAPAGLGIQDAGYATLLPAMGMSPETAAAFILVKRGKELVWIALGYGLLAVLRRPEPQRAARGLDALRNQLVRLLPRGA